MAEKVLVRLSLRSLLLGDEPDILTICMKDNSYISWHLSNSEVSIDNRFEISLKNCMLLSSEAINAMRIDMFGENIVSRTMIGEMDKIKMDGVLLENPTQYTVVYNHRKDIVILAFRVLIDGEHKRYSMVLGVNDMIALNVVLTKEYLTCLDV